jgi:single-stranded DNA-binding protein
VLVEGEIQTQSWEKDGERKSKKIVKVMKVQLCGGKRREEPALEEAFSDFR